MKYQRTRKAVLSMLVLLLNNDLPKRFGKTFKKWALGQIKNDYPLFYWALKK